MPESVAKFGQEIRRFITSLDTGQKIRFGAGLALAVILPLVLYIFLSAPNFVPVFSNVTPGDASAIARRLDELAIPYRVSQSGTTVLVPVEQVGRARLELASVGLPKIAGYDLFDSSSFGTTEKEREIQYQRALEGELTRTINQLEQVEYARVHLVLPEKQLFVKDEPALARAAVFLALKPYETLKPEQVDGIVRLVSHSVRSLQPEDVIIVDRNGRPLSGTRSAPGENITDRLAIEQQVETELEDSVATLLESVFGPGNVVVQANATLDFTKITRDRTVFKPVTDREGIVRTVKELNEYFRGEGTVPEGSPGTDTNIPTYQETAGGGNTEYERSERTLEYEMNQVLEHLEIAPGSLTELSVAVIVNGDLSPTEEERISSLVKAAIGYQADRDQIQVSAMKFDTSLADMFQQELAAQPRAAVPGYMTVAAVIAAALVLLFILYRRRRSRETLGQTVAQYETAAEEEPEEAETLERRIRRIIRNRPEDAANVVRMWLSEE